MAISPFRADRRECIAWALAVTILSTAAVVSAEIHGRSSRWPFLPPRAMAGRSVAAVPDVVGALQLWQATGVQGRRLVVLAGRWSRPMRRTPAEGAESLDHSSRDASGPEPIDANSALFDAARLGLARRIDVVMPPSAYSSRLGEVKGQKPLVREEGAFRLHYNGLERRFSTPDGFTPPRERVIVLVEPSWFDYGSPPDPVEWLGSRGLSWDLLLFALQDPVASADQRRIALEVATAAGAVFLEPASK